MAAAVLAACGGEDRSGAETLASARVVSTPAQIAQESADDYDQNVNGLITGNTLKRWKDDWLKERPAGITGNLVIFQTSAGPAGSEYIKADNENVFTYQESSWQEDRSNGVIKTPGMVLSGEQIDALLRRYGVNPTEDLMVCADGTGSAINTMMQGRCWYTLRYWGVSARHLAVLNGGNQYLASAEGGWTAADFSAEQSPLKNRFAGSVRDLKEDNTILQATLEDVVNVLPLTDQNKTSDGIFLWDARSLDQYSAGELLEAGVPPDGYNYTASFQNGGSRQGHPRGALVLQYTNMLVNGGSDGRYKSKAEIRAYFDGQVDSAGKGFRDGTLQYVGAGGAYQPGDTVYTYCETAVRAAITTVASAVILGHPTRLYDGSMIEWNSLSNIADRNGHYILPAKSVWRTDVLSFFRPGVQAQIAPRDDASTTPYIVNASAEHSDEAILADKAYARANEPDTGSGSTTGGSTTGGTSLPPNPCGGT
jgi:3-mercaptopyruvate sulfurtransferase SseA